MRYASVYLTVAKHGSLLLLSIFHKRIAKMDEKSIRYIEKWKKKGYNEKNF